jgi:hypothetical protein
LSGQPFLDIGPQPRVGDQLGGLQATGNQLGLPLRDRRTVVELPAPGGGIAAQLSGDRRRIAAQLASDLANARAAGLSNAISSRSRNDRYRPVSGPALNGVMPPACRYQRQPTAGATPTAFAASSATSPLAISSQNSRSTSRRCDGAPGDFIADRPVSSVIHPAGLPIGTSTIEVLRRPFESALAAGIDVVHQGDGRTGLLRQLG